MISTKTMATLCSLAALVLLSLPAHAQFNTNLLVNGDAEAGPGGSGGAVASIPGWTDDVVGTTVVNYSAGGGYPVASDPGPADRGAKFFSGGPGNALCSITQLGDLSFAAPQIDAGAVAYDLSGFLGGFATQDDNAVLTITFLDALAAPIGTADIGPVLAADRGNVTALLFRELTGTVPVGARSFEAELVMTRTSGSADDGYADNLSFQVSSIAVVPESGTFALLGVGMLPLAGLLARRRKS